jgi:hypothetical protein
MHGHKVDFDKKLDLRIKPAADAFNDLLLHLYERNKTNNYILLFFFRMFLVRMHALFFFIEEIKKINCK